MPTLKLNKANVDKKCNEPGYYRDEELPGFCLKVTPKLKKVFLVNTKLKGTRKNVTVTIGKHGADVSAEQARARAKEILGELSKGQDPNEEKRKRVDSIEEKKRLKEERNRIQQLTLSTVLDDYIQNKKLKPSTVYNYRCVINASLTDWLQLPLVEITNEMIAARHRSLSDQGPGTADNVMRVLRALFSFAAYNYKELSGHPGVVLNPVKRISQHKQWNRLPRRQTVIKQQDLPAWFKAVKKLNDSPTARDYLTLLLLTGLRKSEAESLRWQCVDLKGDQFEVQETKNHEPLHLPMTPYLHSLFLRRWQERECDTWVFPGRGKEGHITDIQRQMERVTEMSGVEFTLHDLRRTFATIADGLGIGSYTIKRMLNHKNTADVTAGYFAAEVERLRGPMGEISDYILELVGEQSPSSQKPRARRNKVISIKKKTSS